MPTTAEIENGHIIVEQAEIRKATDDEMKLYSKLVEKASRKAKILSDSEKWYGKKALRYNTELTRMMKEHGFYLYVVLLNCGVLMKNSVKYFAQF